MAKEEKKGNPAPSSAPKAQGPAKSVDTEKCKFVECKSKTEKFGFCMEHYNLYMEGIIRGDGQKPSDYAEKLSRHLQRNGTRKVA
jgi:hypothetical protein